MSHKHHNEHPQQLVVKYHGTEQAPEYKSVGAAGFDIAASQYITVYPHKTVAVPTGLFLEIPKGYEVQIRPRSGLSLHHDVIVKNAPGTIDSDYRGEIKVILYNLNKSRPFTIRKGDRIAQGVLVKVEQAHFVYDENHSQTERNDQGFGSTGQQ